jgi:pimeloyl-ACP methyl ester carboxylesterase
MLLLADATRLRVASVGDQDVSVDIPETRYAISDDGVHLAYQVFGVGPFDLLWQSGDVGGLEVSWEHPTTRGLYEALARVARVIRYDLRATGLSDRATALPDLETQVRDTETVLDAVGSLATVIGGAGSSCPSTALFGATHPDRSRTLVLWSPRVNGLEFYIADDPHDLPLLRGSATPPACAVGSIQDRAVSHKPPCRGTRRLRESPLPRREPAATFKKR